MSHELSFWEENHKDHLELYDDDGGKRRKLGKREFCELSEQMNDLYVWPNIRELTPDGGVGVSADGIAPGDRGHRPAGWRAGVQVVRVDGGGDKGDRGCRVRQGARHSGSDGHLRGV